MKRIFFIAAMAATTIGTVSAQDAALSQAPVARQSEKPETLAKRMVSQVNGICHLHADQFSKVNNVLVDYYVKFEALGKQEASIGRAEFEKRFATLRDERDANLKASLEPGQWQGWLASQQKRK